MKLEYKFDYSKIPTDQEFNVRLMVKLTSSEKVVEKKLPLNLGLVLDRSGSMSGQKLAFVKAATENLINRLKSNDYISLVSFDDRVTSLMESLTGDEARKNIKIVGDIYEGGTTNLSGGYEQGYKLSRIKYNKNNITRIILLTDGLANVGETNRDRLSDMSRKYFLNGISTSTIGVGEDYDEELLANMASAGTGNTYYISRPADAESVFSEELGYLLDLTDKNIVVSFEPAINGLKIGQMNSYNELDAGSYEIGDMYKGITRDIILEMVIPAVESPQKLLIGRIKLKYDNIADNITSTEQDIDIYIESVSGNEFANITPDKEVTKKVILLLIAKAKEKVLDCSRHGNYEEASKIFYDTVQLINNFKVDDPDIENELKELKERADNIKMFGREYFTPALQKQIFYERDVISSSKAFMERGLRSRKQHDDVKFYENFLIFDVLTNGLQKNKFEPLGNESWPRLVQLSWKIVNSDNTELSSHNLIFDQSDRSLLSDIENIYNQYPESSRLSYKTGLQEFLESCKKARTLLVSHNLEYLLNCIQSEIIRNELKEDITRYPKYCTMIESIDLLQIPYKGSYKYPSLKELFQYLFGSQMPDTKYDAIKDIEVISKCFFEMIKLK